MGKRAKGYNISKFSESGRFPQSFLVWTHHRFMVTLDRIQNKYCSYRRSMPSPVLHFDIQSASNFRVAKLSWFLSSQNVSPLLRALATLFPRSPTSDFLLAPLGTLDRSLQRKGPDGWIAGNAWNGCGGGWREFKNQIDRGSLWS